MHPDRAHERLRGRTAEARRRIEAELGVVALGLPIARHRAVLRWLCVTLAFVVGVAGATGVAHAHPEPGALPAAPTGAQAGAAALESRLYAPCCYGGTLDIHESDLSRELRKEIEDRVARGEPSDAIQADFVRRYGERVLAARSDRPIAAMGLAVSAALAAAAVALAVVLRRWMRRGRLGPPTTPAARDELDDRVDADLAALD